MKKVTGVRLKLISDIEKYQFIEKITGGGVSMISKGYTEPNNKFLKSCNPKKPTSYTINVDTKNFYVHPMMQLFPFEILHWVN